MARLRWHRGSALVSCALSVAATGAPAQERVEPYAESGDGLEAAPFPEAGDVLEAGEAEDEPWRAHRELDEPWLFFELEQRTRFEHLEHQFRAAASDSSSTALSLRTRLFGELRVSSFVAGAELQDSRVYATRGTPLTTALVNPIEPLQAYLGLRHEGLLSSEDAAALRLGRVRLDVGSQRLVAGNDFRNTTNSFTGLDLEWQSRRRHVLRAFAVMPVLRLPAEPGALADNRPELDRENTEAILWGAFFGSAPLSAGIELEAYVFGLHESDGPRAPSPDRRLFTPGVRLLREPDAGELDFQFEVMLQVGTSRASAEPADTTNLTHRAGSIHVTAGYSFDAAWAPRAALQYDFASGDGNPDDRVNGRFDPLFGARRFDFGPTGLYGAFARSNVSSPGLRFEVAPHRTFDAFAGYRAFWLASARDSWTTAGLGDPAGASGDFVGHQLEGRLRFHPFPGNLTLELGAAYLSRGEFLDRVPGARPGNPLYVYTQLIGTL